MGVETPLFSTLEREIPDFRRYVVDVRDDVPAPPRSQRIRGGTAFTDSVRRQVETTAGFRNAVEKCVRILGERGLVVAACRSGIHRAPVVADAVWGADYVCHAALYRMGLSHVMVLLRAAMSGQCEFDSLVASRLYPHYLSVELCLGWHWCGWERTHSPFRDPADVQIKGHVPLKLIGMTADRTTSAVRAPDDGGILPVPSSFLISTRVVEMSRRHRAFCVAAGRF